jgi:hypothetical protein
MMGEDYEVCVREMRAFFENKPRKLGVLPRMVQVRKDGFLGPAKHEPLLRKFSSSSMLSVYSTASNSSNSCVSPAPPLIDLVS